jgi:hypothetical protein
MKIIHNAFQKDLFKKIVETVTDTHFPWYYSATAYHDEKGLYSYSFSHQVFDTQIRSKSHSIIYPTFLKFLEDNNEKMTELLRIRCGLVGVTPYPYTHEAHVDFPFEHKTALIYLNESDGPTTLYNEKFDPASEQDPRHFYKDLTINTQVNPEPNKMIIFDGLTYHTSCSPTKVPRRLVINFNYV